MPIVATLSNRVGAISEVGGRNVGQIPLGRLGGVGALFGMLVGVFAECWATPPLVRSFEEHTKQIAGLVISLVIIGVVGVWDDIKRLPAKRKLAFQIVAALVTYACGLRIDGVDLPLIGRLHLGWLSMPVTALWIIGVVNAVNLIDGLDGLAGGVLLFASIVNFISAVASGAVIPAVMMSSMGGAILGFLMYNWHPAKIYLGDGGAYAFGFILSVVGLLAPMQKASTGIAFLVPVLALGVPIADTLLTIIRRAIRRKQIFSPDRSHLHHILLDSGISHRKVVVGIYAICCLLCSAALVLVLHRNREVGYYLVGVSVVWCLVWGYLVKNNLKQAMTRIVRSSGHKEARRVPSNHSKSNGG